MNKLPPVDPENPDNMNDLKKQYDALKEYSEHQYAIYRKKIEEIENNYAQLRQVLDKLPYGIFWKDRQSKYLGCNQLFSNHIHLTPEEVIGKTDFELPWPQNEAEAYRNDDNEVMESNKQKVHIIEPFQKADGSKIYIDTTKIPLTNKLGKVYGVLGVFDDVTNRKKTETSLFENLVRQEALISNIIDVIAVIDKEEKIRYKTSNIEKWFGWKPNELIGQSTWINVHPDDCEKTKKVFAQLENDPKSFITGECRYRCKNGQYKWMEYTAVNQFNNSLINGILLSYHDISQRKTAENELENEQNFKQKILDSLPGIFYLYTYPQLKLVMWNKNHETLLGFTGDEIQHRDIFDWHIPEAYPAVREAVDLVMIKGINSLESPLLHKNGTYIPFLMTGAKFSTPTQDYLMGIGIDITENKRIENALKESEKSLKESQKIARLGSYKFDIQHGVWTSSDVLDAIFGIDESFNRSIAGWIEIIHPDWQEEMQNYLISEVIGQHHEFEKEYPIIRYSDKKKCWVHGMGELLYDKNGNPIFMVGTIQDITHRKETELLLIEQREEIEIQNEEYQQLNEELIQSNEEMKQINDELLMAKEKAEESDRLKTAFLQNMSHEIRTPMNAIMGFSSLLTEHFYNKPKLEQYASIINQRSTDLLEIIDDILDISKIESGQLSVNREEFSLNDFFTELEMLYKENPKRLEKSHIEVVFKKDPLTIPTNIVADKGKLRQVFQNLIGNALKFTDQGRIDVGCQSDTQKKLTFFVADTGMGIPVDKQKIIFDRFTQLNIGKTRLYGGTGLGLSIVKGLIEVLEGQIWINSEPGKGSTFYFTIPLIQTTSSTKTFSSRPETTKFHFIGKTILIVEDDPYNTQYLLEILSDTGCIILHTKFGKEAVQICKEQPIDLVLMDIRLPDLDGYNATLQIKQFKPNLKIIAQTAYASYSDREKSKEAGCNDFIGKPVKRDALFAMINNQLNR